LMVCRYVRVIRLAVNPESPMKNPSIHRVERHASPARE
jgi:hypothetical protein